MACRSPSSSRACSRSTRRTARVRAVPVSARSSRSTRTCSSRTPPCRSRKVRSSLDDREPELLRLGHRGDRRALRDSGRRALARAHGRAAESVPPGNGRRAHLRHVPQPDGPQAPYTMAFEGLATTCSALPRDGLLAAARPDRGVHELPPCPESTVQGSSPRCSRSRSATSRSTGSRRCRSHGHCASSTSSADEDRGAHRPAHPQGGTRAAHVPRERRRGLPPARPCGEVLVGRRGAAVAPGDADRVAARRRPVHP